VLSVRLLRRVFSIILIMRNEQPAEPGTATIRPPHLNPDRTGLPPEAGDVRTVGDRLDFYDGDRWVPADPGPDGTYECDHTEAIGLHAGRSDRAVRRGRSTDAKVSYLAARDLMDACRRECGARSPYRNVEPLPPLPTPPPPIGEQLADWIRGWFRR
jgi:hypothetical protein